MIRRKSNGKPLDHVSLAEYIELAKQELARFEGFMEQRALRLSTVLPDMAPEFWDQALDQFRARVNEDERKDAPNA
jgi:hypothetical protein